MCKSVSFKLDHALLDKIEQELVRLLESQNQAYQQRIEQHLKKVKLMPLLRWSGFTLSLLGILLLSFVLFAGGRWSWCPQWAAAPYLLALFIAFAIIFWNLLKIDTWVTQQIRRISRRQIVKFAARCIKPARPLAPYDCEYVLDKNQLTYFRNKEGERKEAWQRKLKGFAYHGQYMTAVFRKPTSLYPRILIMHRHAEDFVDLLDAAAIPYDQY